MSISSLDKDVEKLIQKIGLNESAANEIRVANKLFIKLYNKYSAYTDFMTSERALMAFISWHEQITDQIDNGGMNTYAAYMYVPLMLNRLQVSNTIIKKLSNNMMSKVGIDEDNFVKLVTGETSKNTMLNRGTSYRESNNYNPDPCTSTRNNRSTRC